MFAQIILLVLAASAFARPSEIVPIHPIDVLESIPYALCPANQRHFLLPHEYDCTKFYYCEYGERRLSPSDCALGTHFSFELQVCVHPSQAGCTLLGVPPTTDNPETEAPETEAPETEAPETEAPETEAPETEAPETEAPETEAPPASTEASIISTSSAAPASTEASIISTSSAAPASTEASIISTSSAAPASTEASIISTSSAAPASTEASVISTSSAAPASTEASVISTPTAAPASTEASIISTTTVAPSSTEASVIVTSTAAPENGVTAPEGTEWLANGCPADWGIHWLLPHEEDCTKFYYCNFGQLVERACPPTTGFNPKLQVCDHLWNVDCAASNGSEEDHNSEEENETDGASNEGEWLDNGCPVNWNVHWLLPHESDCGRFYYCVHGQKVERLCSAPLHFNPTLQVCDWPQNVNCGSGGDESSSTEDNNNNGNSEEDNNNSVGESGEDNNNSVNSGEDNNNSGEDNDNSGNSGEDNNTSVGSSGEDNNSSESEWLENGCPADLNVHWLLPHESSCAKFYYCVNGQKEERECREPLFFNPEVQVCDWPQNVNCGSGGDQSSSNEENNSSGNSVEDNDNGVAGSGEDNNNSGNSGEDNNTSVGSSGEDNNSSESEWLENGCPADLNVHWLLPHESSCAKFYYCVNGQKEERECREPLFFNPEVQVCDWPQNVNCGSGGDQSSSNEENNSSGNSVEDNDNGVAGSGEDNNNSGNSGEDNNTSVGSSGEDNKSSESEWLENGCPADLNVHWLLPHESSCAKFYYCVNGQKVERECREPLFFNPEVQVCDWPQNVNCGSGGDQSSSNEENSSGNSVEENDNGVAESGEDNNNSGEDSDDNSVGNSGEVNNSNESEWLENGCPADFNVYWLLPHESDCAKFYYCVNGQKRERKCRKSLFFCPELQVCDWPQNVNCGSGGDQSSSNEENSSGNSVEDNDNGVAESGEDNNNSVNSGEDSDDNSVGNSGEVNNSNESEWLENGCPADFNVHWLLPHESNCAKFYYCVNGRKRERKCRKSLFFNPELQVCDWPQNVNCGSGGDQSSSNEENNSVGNSGEVNNSNESEWLENGCPADFNVHWLLPHESDCAKFYYCVNGQKRERKCRKSLFFNPELQVCDWPQNVNCGSGGDQSSSNEENNSDGNSGEVNNSSESEWLGNGCPADFNVHWLLPHESDCAKFYYCVNGQKRERKCRKSLFFNPELQVCDWPQNVNCGSGGDQSSSNEENNSSGNSVEDNDNGVAGSGEDNNNSVNSGEDSDDNSVGNSGEVNNSNESEWLENGCPADFNVHWLLPHESNCAKFYYCVNGQKRERKCRKPLFFNPEVQVCDWPQNVNCSSGGDESSSNEDNNNNAGSSEEEINNSEEGSGENSGENGTVIAPEEEPDHSKCTNGCNVLPWAHETACDKYWRCEGAQAVLVVCSEGLHFNAGTGTCDFICNSNCVRENVQTTAGKQGLKIFVPWDKK